MRHALYDEHGRASEPLEAYTERFTSVVHDAIARDTWRIWVAEVADRVVGAM